MSIPIRQQIDNAVSGAAAISLTLSSALVGDVVVVLHADNFHTAAEMTTPTGTAVGGGWSLKHTLDGGLNDNHAKVWMGTVTTAGGTVVEGTANTDHERYLGAWVLPGTVLFDTAASTDSDATSVTHVAPTVTPTVGQLDDLLICLFGTQSIDVNYTMPGSMTARTERDTGFATYRGADEQLTSDAATGTRTATASVTDTWFAVSVLVQSITAASAPMARRGPNWQRRFRHPQILPLAPVTTVAAIGASETDQRSEVDAAGTKQAAGAGITPNRSQTSSAGLKATASSGTVQQRSATVSTGAAVVNKPAEADQRSVTVAAGIKKAVGAAAVVARSSTVSTVRKQAAGAGAASQRSSTASSGVKGTGGAGAVVQRSSTATTTRKQAVGTGLPAARPVSASSGRKQALAATTTIAHVGSVTSGIKQAVGAAGDQQRSTTLASRDIGGPAYTQQRTVTSATGVKATAGTGIPSCRVTSTGTGTKKAVGTGAVAARPLTIGTGIHKSSGPGVAAARIQTANGYARVSIGVGRVQQRSSGVAVHQLDQTTLRQCVSGRENIHALAGREPDSTLSGREPARLASGRDNDTSVSGRENNRMIGGREEGSNCD